MLRVNKTGRQRQPKPIGDSCLENRDTNRKISAFCHIRTTDVLFKCRVYESITLQCSNAGGETLVQVKYYVDFFASGSE